jgi:hypothetical protein
MNCPECDKRMVALKRDTSVGKSGAKYARTMWVCKKCDAWVTVEVRKGKSSRAAIAPAKRTKPARAVKK